MRLLCLPAVLHLLAGDLPACLVVTSEAGKCGKAFNRKDRGEHAKGAEKKRDMHHYQVLNRLSF